MTRAELLTALGQELNKETSSMNTTTKNRLLGYLNRRHRALASAPGLQHLRETTLTFSSAQSRAFYGLANVAKVNRIWDTTNDRALMEISLSEYRTMDPDAINYEGTPECFVWSGYGSVARQPANASELFWKSTAAGDTQNSYLEGEITGNYPLAKTKALTGTTAVSVDTSVTTWERIHKAYLASAAAGVVTLHEDLGSGTELARIGIGQTQQRYWQFYLWRTPSATIEYSADVTREITDLAQDTDEPILPIDFHDLLFLGAAMDEYRHLDDTRYSVVREEYRRREGQFQYWLAETASGASVSIEPPSRLGAWFPSGT
jgi:hypothetical protein